MVESSRKGIILAGGAGTRLYPLTKAVSKQLMPLYDKPMIYYPLTTLMNCGIKEILIICNPHHLNDFKSLLGNGKQWGIEIQYKSQPSPDGIAQAFLLGRDFLEDKNVVLILGDNLFYGNNFENNLKDANREKNGATIFVYPVSNPSRYGIVNFDDSTNKVLNFVEKPSNPKSNYAVTGLYFFDNKVINYAENLTPSARNELEITDIINIYLNSNNLKLQILGTGIAWLDTGTFDSLQEAGTFIRTLERRQGLKIGSPEETAWRNNLINDKQLIKLAKDMSQSSYGNYLINLIKKTHQRIY